MEIVFSEASHFCLAKKVIKVLKKTAVGYEYEH
jgi:hypothetical protein